MTEQLKAIPKDVLEMILKDKTTGRNIIWATNDYEAYGDGFSKTDEITLEKLERLDYLPLQPRAFKCFRQQKERTKKHAEVSTPAWVVNMMNNLCDTEWFESEDVFNIQLDGSWKTVNHKIIFPKDKDWKDYIELKKLEITCGETPYLVSRYDAITGIPIDIRDRIGILDRKLRVVNENTYNENEWFKWTVKSYCRTYGYEFQGDNLLIGRVNLLLTYMEYLKDRWNREPCTAELILILDIISWNIWQMDGLSGCVPFDTSQKCEIYDWS